MKCLSKAVLFGGSGRSLALRKPLFCSDCTPFAGFFRPASVNSEPEGYPRGPFQEPWPDSGTETRSPSAISDTEPTRRIYRCRQDCEGAQSALRRSRTRDRLLAEPFRIVMQTPPHTTTFRDLLPAFVREQALPVDKYGHQPRLYALSRLVGQGCSYDDDVVFAAAWLHDLGVFLGHRPVEPERLAGWDHVRYAIERAPAILRETGFPEEKIAPVLRAMETHQPRDTPESLEAAILRDADILEQLGAVGILRAVAKVGRDTRYPTFTPAVAFLRRNLDELPGALRLPTARALASPRIELLRAFLEGVEGEAQGCLF